jgi:plastocyanin
MVAQRVRRFLLAVPSLIVPAILVLGCGPGDESAAPATSESATPAASDASAPAGEARQGRASKSGPAERLGEEPFDSAELGALHGEIRFSGEPPERFALGAASSKECSHHQDVDQRANEVVVNDGKLANAYVYLKSGYDPAKIPPAAATTATLEQKGCMYVPRVLAVRAGATLQVTNGDPTSHNVHTRAKRNPEVNKTMGANQAPLEFRLEKPERPVPFKCDIHPWMGAAVFVEEHPWFAVTDEAGRFRIPDVPPGEYVVEVIHERLGAQRGSVTVTAGRSSGVTFTFDAD